MSWVAALDDEQRPATLARALELVRGGSTPRELQVHFAVGVSQLSQAASSGHHA